jgi:hypothetical protein
MGLCCIGDAFSLGTAAIALVVFAPKRGCQIKLTS